MKKKATRSGRRSPSQARHAAPTAPPPIGAPTVGARWWWAALLVGAVLVAYLPALGAGFVWDDDAHVTRPDLRSLDGLWRIWSEPGATQQYYPLLHSAFWIEHRLWGNAPLGYHLLNVLLHAACACLLIATLRRLQVPGAALAAALFALHPVHVESVAWISEQKNTLSLAFYLGAALSYLRFDASQRRFHYLAASALFLLGLLTKTVVASLPAALLLVLWWRRGRLSWRQDALPLVPWLAAGAAAGLFTAWFEARLLGAAGAEFALSLLERLLLAGRVVWFYLGKLLAPVGLMFVYPRWTIDVTEWRQYLPPLAALLALAAAFAARHRQRAPLALALFFGGSLFPVLGFLNVYPFVFAYVADHFQYLASLGPIVGAGAGLALLARRLDAPWRALADAGCVALLALLGVLTWRQCQTYADARTLYEATLARNPDCYLCVNNLATFSLAEGRTDEAIARYREVLRLKPTSVEALSNLGNLLVQSGDAKGGMALYERALAAAPNNVITRTNLGIVLFGAGRVAEAKAQFEAALRIMPDHAPARRNLATIQELEARARR